MYDTINVKSSVTNLEKQNKMAGYSSVVLRVSDDISYVEGTDSGRVLTLECPWGTPAMAKRILARIRGYQYQPYKATKAYIDPAAEIGDAVAAGSVHGSLLTKNVTLGPLYVADVSAPGDESINYKYEYKPAQERQINRRFGQVESQFKIQAGLIEAKVARTGGDDSSFGWALDEKSWTLSSGGGTVLKADKNGVEVTGKITATSGKIGGFEITADALSYNGQTWGGTNTNGVYIGPYGIQLGRKFRVDSAGNLTAESGTFTGAVRAGSIQYGGDAGYFDGSGLSGHSVTGNEIGYSTIGTPNVNSGVKVPLGYANFSNDVFNGVTMAPTAKVGSITFKDNKKYAPGTLYYKAWDGSNKSVRIIMEL